MLKIDIIGDDELIIYLYNNINKFDFKNELSLEDSLRKLFIRLNDYYNIKIDGYYDVDVYIDVFYGFVFYLIIEVIEYYDYFDNLVEMKINIHKNKFLYLVDNYDIDINKFEVYKFLNNIYLLPKIKLSNMELARLIENSKIIYNSDEIVKKGIKINS